MKIKYAKKLNRNHFRLVLVCLLAYGIWLFPAAQTSRAERRYTLSGQLDLNGGATNSLSGSQSGTLFDQQELSSYYSASPSLNLETTGQNFDLDAAYGFSYNRYEQNEPIITRSHNARGEFRSNLSENVHLKIASLFNSSPDYLTYELARTLVVFNDSFGYAYTPTPSKQSFKTSNSSIGLNWDLSPQSYLSFTVGGSFRDYGGGDQTIAVLTNQYRYQGSLGYNRRTSSRTTWKVEYAVSRNQYESYGTSLTHRAMAGFTYQLRPTVQISFTAGPSYVTTSVLDRNYWGFAGSFRATKTMELTQVSLFASHYSGDSSGIGFVSDTDRGGIAFAFRPAKYINIAFSSSAYRSKQRKDIFPLSIWGVDGGMQVSYLVNRYIRLGGGASYRKVEGYSVLNREYKQFYGSVTLTAPEFWNTKR